MRLLFYAYRIITWLSFALPALALGGTLLAVRRRKQILPLRTFVRAGGAGAMMGGATALTYASLAGAVVPPGQMLLACWFGIGAICVFLALNWLLGRGVGTVFRLDAKSGQACCRGAQIGAGLVQGLLLVAIGLPYLVSLLIVYRPKAPSPGDPRTLIDAPFETVKIPATDGIGLEAWWIPPAYNHYTDHRGSLEWGRDTVLFCPGFGADKASQLFLVRDLVANGYNVLALDLRGHGRSAGQFTGFGGIEGRDVLGAIRWIRKNHPQQSRRILGLGDSLGAVALIEAAADQSRESQAIDAIAAYNPYDDFGQMVRLAAHDRIVPPGRWLLTNLVLPMASGHVGSDLSKLAPSRAIQKLWPRPILVLGNSNAAYLIGERSEELYQSAQQPRLAYWSDAPDRDALLHDSTAALTVRIFFDEERSIL